uniref:Uncharacterized protein n=1 Tax=Anguilla anguilla TaxID=7936 RepID=A0A0E9PKJ3_ANGAN
MSRRIHTKDGIWKRGVSVSELEFRVALGWGAGAGDHVTVVV